MRAVDLLINSGLPEDLRDYGRTLDSKGVGQLMAAVAIKYPDKYEEISQMIGDAGRKASYFQGETVTLDDYRPVIDRDKLFAAMDAEIDRARSTLGEDSRAFREARKATWVKYADEVGKLTMEGAKRSNNNLALSVASGARGKADQLKAILSTPGMYSDESGEPVPIFIRHSYAEGLRPNEYLASAFSTRHAVMSTKNATAKGGDVAKQMIMAVVDQVVTEKDCGTANGILLDADDDSLRYRVMARDTAGVKAGELVGKDGMSAIRKRAKKGRVLVRSPLTCQAPRGVCAKCSSGMFGHGKLPEIGDSVGVTAGQSLSEPITQNALNCLLEGTKVLMADYSEKAIEDVKVGDCVMGSDMEGNIKPVAVTGVWDQGMQPVKKHSYHVCSGRDPNRLKQTEITLTLGCTSKHEVLVLAKGYSRVKKAAGKLNSDDKLFVVTSIESRGTVGSSETGYLWGVPRKNEVEEMGLRQCWDLTVDNESALFVLANGLIVSNTKHVGSIVKGKKIFSGFDVLNRFAQAPENFPERATVSELEGTVENVEEAPQGGHYVTVAGERHYVAPTMTVTVKVGDRLEAGDSISEGIPDPKDIVRLRGLGAGRKYYAEKMKQILDDSGMRADPRNVEMISRALVDHVQIDDPEGLGDYLPDDIVSYNTFAASYTPPATARLVKPQEAAGKYLHAPALHYSIGTKLTPKMTTELSEAGMGVLVDDEGLNITPLMLRMRAASHYRPDWLASQHTSYLKKQLNEAAVRGEETNTRENVHFAPRLAVGEGFGSKIRETGMF